MLIFNPGTGKHETIRVGNMGRCDNCANPLPDNPVYSRGKEYHFCAVECRSEFFQQARHP